jgi:nicotinate-nucleotide--dimethylbenzimidazole phosphoribosyltransferase
MSERASQGQRAADERSREKAIQASETGGYARAAAEIGPVDEAAEADARDRQDGLTKPRGSLGRVEALGIQLAAISGSCPPPLPRPAAVAVFAADHGVVAEGVTPWPQEVTGLMVANFLAGGAAINVLARQAGASVTVVDVGMASDLPVQPAGTVAASGDTRLLHRRVRAGTADIAVEPAMSEDEVRRARDVGADVARDLVAAGARALVCGDMGIGNTTAAAAVIAALTGRPAASVTGRGTGVDDDGLRRKIAVVARSVARLAPGATPLDVLRQVGGLEIAALAGFIVGGAARRVPVIADGVISAAALIAAQADCPAVLPYVIAGHRSTEPGATAVLEQLGLEPVLDLQLRLGEGTGACLALSVVEASARILGEMATLAEIGAAPQ